MKQRFINDVLQEMLPHLNNAQCEKLQEVLRYLLFNYEITEIEQMIVILKRTWLNCL